VTELAWFQCQQCGAMFFDTTDGRKAKQKWCSKRCADDARVNGPHVCQGCGKTFYAKRSDRTSYCSRACAFEHREPPHKGRDGRFPVSENPRRYCHCCFFPIAPHAGPMVTCSSGCADLYRKMKQFVYAERKRANWGFICKECGRECDPDYGDKRSHFCSDTCAGRYHRRLGDARRRARMREQYVEDVPLQYVYQRDGGRCRACGRKTILTTDPTDQRAATRDHIIPVSRGGMEEKRNVQLLCRRCNSRKCDGSIGSQLLLVG